MTTGFIYCIENIVNGKKYVGKTTSNIEERWLKHKHDSIKRSHEVRPLYRAFKKYGIDNFKISILEQCSLELLSEKEANWIEELNTYKHGYNATLGGDGTLLYDYEEIIEVYKEGGTIKEAAETIGCSADTVSRVLKANNISKNIVEIDYSKTSLNKPIEVSQYNLSNEFIQKFKSVSDAARWLYDNGYIKKLQSGVRSHISNCAKGKQKHAYKFIWRYE